MITPTMIVIASQAIASSSVWLLNSSGVQAMEALSDNNDHIFF
jgi:hypothetical protein